MNLGALKLSIILFGLSLLLKFQAWRHPAYRERLKEKNLTGQFIARDEEIGRWFKIQDGRVASGSGVLKDADVTVAFKNAALGAFRGDGDATLVRRRIEGIPSRLEQIWREGSETGRDPATVADAMAQRLIGRA